MDTPPAVEYRIDDVRPPHCRPFSDFSGPLKPNVSRTNNEDALRSDFIAKAYSHGCFSEPRLIAHKRVFPPKRVFNVSFLKRPKFLIRRASNMRIAFRLP